MDRLLVITPTWESNKLMYEGLPVDPEDVYHEARVDVLADIIKKVELEHQEYETYLEKLKLYNVMKKSLKQMHSASDIYKVNPQVLIDAFNMDVYGSEPPTTKWGGKRPVLGLMIDDCQGSKLFKSHEFAQFCLRHRHLGGGLGISVFMAAQTYKSQQGGVPVALRDNMTHLMLFPSRNVKSLMQIVQEVSDDISEDEFLEVFGEATQDSEHDFLFISFKPKKPEHRFRKNLSEFLIPTGKPAPPEDGTSATKPAVDAGAPVKRKW